MGGPSGRNITPGEMLAQHPAGTGLRPHTVLAVVCVLTWHLQAVHGKVQSIGPEHRPPPGSGIALGEIRFPRRRIPHPRQPHRQLLLRHLARSRPPRSACRKAMKRV
jgi:hypothetical protein